MNATPAAAASANPLLAPWTAPYGLPPFDQIQPEHFAPAFAAAMASHKAELEAITVQRTPATFADTLVAYDAAGHELARIESVFGCLCASATSPALQAVQREMAAPLAAHHSSVYLDRALFERIDTLHARRGALGLDAESLRLLERVHLDFVRAGARMEGAARERYAALMSELATLTTRFAQNVLHDENDFVLVLHGEAELAGLPGFVRDAAAQAANERGRAGQHVITLSRSLVVPFLTFSDRRDLREQAWRAWTSRGEHAGEHDNRPLVRQILKLRREQARLHGYANYAAYALADTMAGTQAAVQALLDEVWPRALAAAQQEEQALRGAMLAAGLPADAPLEAWDWRHWAEKVRVARFAVEDAEVKPYFELDRMALAAFDCAERLFGITLHARADLPVYHPDVKAYEVHDAGGEVIGIFLHDNFARPTKRSGAWMSSLRWQCRNAAGGRQIPVILNNNNFAKGGTASPLAASPSPPEGVGSTGRAGSSPTLLSMDDVRTLFHEFGHGLHGLLSSVAYKRLSGTQVLRDFVELPSQMFEHWMSEPAVLERHARRHGGEAIPHELVHKLLAARRFNQGYETVRYTASAIADMAVHAREDDEPPEDPCAYEAEVLAKAGLPAAIGLNHRLVHFQHLFAGSAYAAGYYVYLWAEVLDADGYGAFVEAGDPFDAEVASRLKRFIYSSGNTLEPGAAYAAFRGRQPLVEPLLRKRGLIADEATS